MTREIKFRMWHKRNKVMNWLGWIRLKEWVKVEIEYPEWYPDDIIRMQYTWLIDSNWKEIYEWDIVAVHKLIKSRNTWKIIKNWYNNKRVVKFYITNNKCWYNIGDWKAVVIGNIHENPELLSSQSDNESLTI